MGGRSGIDLGLNENEKKYLLSVARSVIQARCEGKNVSLQPPPSSKLQEKRGAFVTLHKKGELRGCIGYIEAIKPLYQTVAQMAEAAAFNDPRFPPVTNSEIEDLEIEISVLTPLTKIDNIETIEVGKHGILIRKGFYQGLLLPQVATEYGWDRITFLNHTCTKAGLPPNCWKDPDTEIYVFSADIFSEKDLQATEDLHS